MRVAVVRGPSLNPWEMQAYEQLAYRVELLGVGSFGGHYDISQIRFPVKRLACVGEYLAYVPGGTKCLYQLVGDPQYLIGFDRVVEGYDIVHAAELRSAYSWQAVQAKRKGLVKAVTLTIYENIPLFMDDNQARLRLQSEVVRGVDHFLAINKQAKAALLIAGVEERKISIVGQGVDTRSFAPRKFQISNGKFQILMKKYGIENDDFVVLSVGRMVWEKGWYDLIRTAYKISLDCSNRMITRKFKFFFVGVGAERERMEKMVERLGLEQSVIFSGGIPYEYMPDVFRLADVLVLASLPTHNWNEQFGGVLIEAMATGLPVVATMNGGILQTVEEKLQGQLAWMAGGVTVGKGGIYVPPQDFSSLTSAILRLNQDQTLRERMGIRNRKRAVSEFDVKAVSKKVYEIWKNVLRTERRE